MIGKAVDTLIRKAPTKAVTFQKHSWCSLEYVGEGLEG
jgi:hypothetical protein